MEYLADPSGPHDNVSCHRVLKALLPLRKWSLCYDALGIIGLCTLQLLLLSLAVSCHFPLPFTHTGETNLLHLHFVAFNILAAVAPKSWILQDWETLIKSGHGPVSNIVTFLFDTLLWREASTLLSENLFCLYPDKISLKAESRAGLYLILVQDCDLCLIFWGTWVKSP